MKMTLGRIFAWGMCLFAGTACATNEATLTIGDSFGVMSIEEMGAVFARSEEAHAESMALLTRSMTLDRASEVLQKSNRSTPALTQVIGMVKNSQGKFRKAPPKGYAGIDGARKMLNDMIYESMLKYDEDIQFCTDYYSRTCGAMEVLRGKIAGANYIAANSRALILDSQSIINKAEVDIPTNKLELKEHNEKCAKQLGKLKARLKIVTADIAVMTTILKMTDCDAKTFVQMEKMAVLRCEDRCTKQSFITVQNDEVKQEINKLKSSLSKNLMVDTFADMFDGIQGLAATEVELVQIGAPIINKTKFNNPPTPKTEVPGNPCTDPDKGAPSAADKRAAKCTLSKGNCYKLQERFLLIQSGMKDEEADLQEEIDKVEHYCDQARDNLEAQIADDQDRLENAQTKLALATEKESTAGEIARQTNAQHEESEGDLQKTMSTCSKKYIDAETELCALKKIRGELYKVKGGGHSPIFQDCEVSKWSPGKCTKECAYDGTGGDQNVTREILGNADGGAKCLPLTSMRTCNNKPCKVDCRLDVWSGWSKCSAECGGGVQQRVREVTRAMKYGGKPCGQTSESRACATAACEKDCVLSDWTKWTTCSKDCDGGTSKRQKFVTQKAQGAGECSDGWSKDRLEYKECNMQRCLASIKCTRKIDVVLLIDGSGSLGQKGWNAEIKMAQKFVDAFADGSGGSNAQLGVILYSGPSTWSGVSRCWHTGEKCNIERVTKDGFTNDMTALKAKIAALKWPKGSTLTTLALLNAKSFLGLGRPDAHSNVIVITDGRPLSYRGTAIVSKMIRKSARLIWVPVTRYAPLAKIKKWATRRWQENVVQVSSFDELETSAPITHLVANICPAEDPEIEAARR